MAFTQITYRESLRDIEICLRAQEQIFYHMDICGKVSRSTIADSNEQRNWNIYADPAYSFINTTRKLYSEEPFASELEQTAYALDATTIDLCLSMFPWANFRQNKGAIKLHTLLDLRCTIPTFIHISDGKLHEVDTLDSIPLKPGLSPSDHPLNRLHQRRLSVCALAHGAIWDLNSRVESTWNSVNHAAENGIRLRTTGQHPFFFVLLAAVFLYTFWASGSACAITGRGFR